MTYKSFFEPGATGLHGLPGYSGDESPEITARKPVAPQIGKTASVAPHGGSVAAVAPVARSPHNPLEMSDDLAAFEDRAAVCEHDGELPASHSELVALACVAPVGPGETAESRGATIINIAAHFDVLNRLRKARDSR